MRRAACRVLGSLISVAMASLLGMGCDAPLDPIVVDGGTVRVRNQTDSDWSNVEVWVNEYYRGTARTIPAGGFVNEPVSRFVASRGQRLAATAAVTSVVVLATDEAGQRVRVAWGSPVMH
jgi:hypothetical protein